MQAQNLMDCVFWFWSLWSCRIRQKRSCQCLQQPSSCHHQAIHTPAGSERQMNYQHNPNSTICMTLVLSTVRRTSFRFHEAAFLVCDRERFSLVVLAHINYKPTGFKSINPCPKSLAGGIHHIWGTQLQRELWRTLSLLKDTWMTQKRLKYKSIKHHDWTCDGSLEQPLWNQSQVAGWSFMAISTACCWQAALNIGDAASNQVYLSGRS